MSMLQTTPYRGGKRWNDAILRLETRQPFEPCEPVMVHRTERSDRNPDRSHLQAAYKTSPPVLPEATWDLNWTKLLHM